MEFTSGLRADRYVPTEAIVLYRKQSGIGGGFATVHGVEIRDEVPTIQAGKMLGTADMAALMMQIMPARRLTFIDSRVLAISEQDMVWWVPPSKRTMWFNTNGSDGLGQAFGEAWQPGLVFCAGDCGWRVYAVKGERRPEADTPLYQAPYYNVNTQGLICRGSAEAPEGIGPDQIEGYERAFFQSRFTHPNVNAKSELTRSRGGAGALWKRLLNSKAKSFPQGTLVPLKHTVGELVAQMAARYE